MLEVRRKQKQRPARAQRHRRICGRLSASIGKQNDAQSEDLRVPSPPDPTKKNKKIIILRKKSINKKKKHVRTRSPVGLLESPNSSLVEYPWNMNH